MTHLIEQNEQAAALKAQRNLLRFIHSYPHNFIEQAWADNDHLHNHFGSKWANSKGGYDGIMRFIADLDGDNLEALLTWINNHYLGK
jgi:hypothetical protein